MTDGCRFAYGSDFSMEFFDLPPGYRFSDVAKVHNHSFVTENGDLGTLERGSMLPVGYRQERVFQARVYFTCYIDGI